MLQEEKWDGQGGHIMQGLIKYRAVFGISSKDHWGGWRNITVLFKKENYGVVWQMGCNWGQRKIKQRQEQGCQLGGWDSFPGWRLWQFALIQKQKQAHWSILKAETTGMFTCEKGVQNKQEDSTIMPSFWLGVSLVAQMVKTLPAMQETWVQSLGQKHPLEKGMVTHSTILAWRIPLTEEAGGSKGLQRVKHNSATDTLAWGIQWRCGPYSDTGNTGRVYFWKWFSVYHFYHLEYYLRMGLLIQK